MTTNCVDLDILSIPNKPTPNSQVARLGSWELELGSYRALVSGGHSQRKDKRLFERLSAPAQESGRTRAGDDAMVVRQGQRQHQPRLELRAVPRGLVAAARDAEDRDFGPVDDRAEPHAADAAEVRDRDDAARHLVERELAGARLLGDLG